MRVPVLDPVHVALRVGELLTVHVGVGAWVSDRVGVGVGDGGLRVDVLEGVDDGPLQDHVGWEGVRVTDLVSVTLGDL